MAFQSLYRRYRPRRFAEVQGQDHVVRALRNAVSGNSVAHAYLFSGPRGTGKTSTARILAKAINCESPLDGEPCCECASCLSIEAGNSLDVSELDAASNNGVEAMRELVGRVSMGGSGKSRLYILDEVHMLSAAASNALLKTLEEPPAHVIFVLATTDPQKVLPTIRSRTQHYEFRLIGADVLQSHLRSVASHAGLEVTDEVIERAVEQGHGSARDALSALDQLVAGGGAADADSSIDEIVEALCECDTGRALTAVGAACQAGRDPRYLGEALLARLRDAFLSVLAPEVVSLPDEALELVSDQGRRLGPAATVRAMDALGEALLAMREAPDSRIPLEIALVRFTRPELDNSPSSLLERIERLERANRQTKSEHFKSEVPHNELPKSDHPKSDPPKNEQRAALGGVSGSPSKTFPSREELTVAWADHVLIGLRPRAKGLFGAGRFLAVEDETAVFSLPTEGLRMKAQEMLSDLEAALGAYFSCPVPVRLVVEATGDSFPIDDKPVESGESGLTTRTIPAGPSAQASSSDDESIDLSELRDAPPDSQSTLDRLTQAFPGTEIISGDIGGRT